MTGNERNAIETYECDVLVAGSGRRSGMSAAITARYRGLDVLIVEKEPRFGGTTARSGGWLWIPGTSLAKAYGIEETPEQARTYLRHEAGNNFDAARVDAFLSAGPEAVDFFTTKTALRFDMPLVFPDYHAEAPGGTQGGRSMVTRPFDGRELGDQIKTLGMPLPELTVFGMMLGSGKEIIHFMRVTKSLTSAVYVAKRLSRHLMDVLRYGRGMTLTNGNALAGRLAKSALDLKIPMWLSSPVRELTVENGAVHRCDRCARGTRCRAFARARASCSPAAAFRTMSSGARQCFRMRRPAMSIIRPGRPATPATGCALRKAPAGRSRIGCRTRRPGCRCRSPRARTARSGVMPHFIDRAKPGVIAVMRDGKRFANEGNSYHDFVQAMIKAAKPGEEIAAYLVCDHQTLRKYGLGCVPPFPMPLGHHLAHRLSHARRHARGARGEGRHRCEGVRRDRRAVQCDRAAGLRRRLRQGLESL